MSIVRRFESLFWAVAREINTQQILEGRARPTSFPFLSADTFRSIGDLVVNNEDSANHLSNFRGRATPRTVYIEMDFLRNPRNQTLVARLIDGFQQKNQAPVSVILHNSDKIPPETFFSDLEDMKARVFAVNLLDGYHGAVPIPLGIENLTRKRGGTTEDFHILRELVLRGEKIDSKRSHLIFANFRTRTNRMAREKTALQFSSSRHGFSDGGMSVRDYRKRILSSMFVVSPPGNGPDCFRTWEAMYLGAVPIVLRNQIAESLTQDLPIWVVSDWEEVLDQNDTALEQIFKALRARSSEKAYFPFWLREISTT